MEYIEKTGKTVDDPNRMKFQTDEFYLKSEEELRQLFPGCEEAIANTAEIAECSEKQQREQW